METIAAIQCTFGAMLFFMCLYKAIEEDEVQVGSLIASMTMIVCGILLQINLTKHFLT